MAAAASDEVLPEEGKNREDEEAKEEEGEEEGEEATLDVRLRSIEDTLARMQETLHRVESQIVQTQASCANMDEHIGFVEGVYSAVRRPLSFLAGRLRADPLPAPKAAARLLGAPGSSAGSGETAGAGADGTRLHDVK